MNLTYYLDIIEDSLFILSDSRMFLHLLILWAVSIVFCWKVFPLFCSSKEASSDLQMSPPKTPLRTPISLSTNMSMMKSPVTSTPTSRNQTMMSPNSPNLSLFNSTTKTKNGPEFLVLLEFEVCQKAKEAGKHPSYCGLVLSLVHNYSLDINKPVLSKRLTIFHCACLSGSLELVSSLSPLAELDQTSSQGESPLYLAVYAAGHRLVGQPQGEEEGLEVVRHLLQAGAQINSSNSAGWTALHQAQRRGHARMIR